MKILHNIKSMSLKTSRIFRMETSMHDKETKDGWDSGLAALVFVGEACLYLKVAEMNFYC